METCVRGDVIPVAFYSHPSLTRPFQVDAPVILLVQRYPNCTGQCKGHLSPEKKKGDLSKKLNKKFYALLGFFLAQISRVKITQFLWIYVFWNIQLKRHCWFLLVRVPVLRPSIRREKYSTWPRSQLVVFSKLPSKWFHNNSSIDTCCWSDTSQKERDQILLNDWRIQICYSFTEISQAVRRNSWRTNLDRWSCEFAGWRCHLQTSRNSPGTIE